MTDEQRIKCHALIHTAALSAGAGNCIPIPGVGMYRPARGVKTFLNKGTNAVMYSASFQGNNPVP